MKICMKLDSAFFLSFSGTFGKGKSIERVQFHLNTDVKHLCQDIRKQGHIVKGRMKVWG